MHFTPSPFWARIVSIATGGLAGLAVADDELALTATDRGHGVDGLDPGLQWLVHRLAADDARRLHLEPARLVRVDGTLAVDRLTEPVDDPADERVADRDRQDATGALDRPALLDVAGAPEDHRADRLLVEVQRETEHAALELEHLVDRGVGQTGDPRDAVTDLEHSADLRLLDRWRERLDMPAQRRCDLVGTDGELGHAYSLALCGPGYPVRSIGSLAGERPSLRFVRRKVSVIRSVL